MKKKIMFLISTWQDAYSRSLMEGVEQYAESNDIEIHVFNAYGATVEFYSKETEVFYLPEITNYDGVMVLFNSVDTDPYMEDFTKKCKSLNIPMMSIDRLEDGIAYCGINNYESMYILVEHLVKEHGYKVLDFIGGPEDHPETVVRYQAFKDCLDKYGLQPHNVGFFGYMKSSGVEAYRKWKRSGEPMAECYVCANDFLALGFSGAAKEDGYIAPRDYKITGFDNVDLAQKNIPPITSIDRNLKELGYKSLEHLVKLINKETTGLQVSVPGKISHGTSCGCPMHRKLEQIYTELNDKMVLRDYIDDMHRKTREFLCGNNSFAQYQESFRRCNALYGIEEVVIGVNKTLLNQDFNRKDVYDEEMDTYGLRLQEVINRKKELVPQEWRESGEKIFFFASLHCKERTLGYSIFKYRPKLLEFLYHRTFNESVAMAVENVRQTQILNQVNQKLECLYITDSMTGLLNRFGYNSFAGECFKRNKGKIYIVFIDMDNLKKLNDGYGHDMGDIALKGIAAAIRAVYTDTDVHVRMGGDEFLVMGPFVSEELLKEKEEKMAEYLIEYSHSEKLPFELEVSMGYSFNEKPLVSTGLEYLLQFADEKMYEKKQAKKKQKMVEQK